ncbi:hypothetical protein AVEN_220878-1 [Araneus ventricosus]|uniref:Uncharacterized protein n=1 Tax=Araneus ventricosus TaxID=182803 RepID=A0A4Y2W7Z9_ARAVE|nr:hypothetical protein AVEN_220878-1 [Araneus ventricosus]
MTFSKCLPSEEIMKRSLCFKFAIACLSWFVGIDLITLVIAVFSSSMVFLHYCLGSGDFSCVRAVFCLVFMATLSSDTDPVRLNLAINAVNMLEDGFSLFLKTLDLFLSVSEGLWSQR